MPTAHRVGDDHSQRGEKKCDSSGHQSMAPAPAAPGLLEEGFDLGFECACSEYLGFRHRTTRFWYAIGLL